MLTNKYWIALGFALAVRPVAQAAPAPPQPRVVVVAPPHVATGKDSDQYIGELVADTLAIALADRKHLSVVDRQRLEAVRKEQMLSLEGLVDPATAAKVGRLLSADLVVAGSVVNSGEQLHLTTHVIAVDSQQIVGTAQTDAARDKLDEPILKLADEVARISGAPLPTYKAEDIDHSPEARLHLMRGIGLHYAGNPDQAIICCLRAAQLDPRMQEARLWIARSYLKAGEPQHARIELDYIIRSPVAPHFKAEAQKLLRTLPLATRTQ